jgi:hypothetical protein
MTNKKNYPHYTNLETITFPCRILYIIWYAQAELSSKIIHYTVILIYLRPKNYLT